MDSVRIAIATLATLGSGVVLGLATQPQMRTFPDVDWRARYRTASAPAEPAPQPGVSYFGDGSTAWVFGGMQHRYSDDLPPVRIPVLREDYADWQPPVITEPAEYRSSNPDGAGESERMAAQAVVADALARSAPPDDRAKTATDVRPEARQESDQAGPTPVSATATQLSPNEHLSSWADSSGPSATW